jgi:hypothetical protein
MLFSYRNHRLGFSHCTPEKPNQTSKHALHYLLIARDKSLLFFRYITKRHA